MADVFSKKKRSWLMSRIRSRNTSPERILLRKLKKNGRYSKKNCEIEGKPDIVFPERKLAVFVDGCFWHKCPKCYSEPRSHKAYWLPKIRRNVERDRKINKTLRTRGWTVLRFWEHEVKKNTELCVKKIKKKLKKKA